MGLIKFSIFSKFPIFMVLKAMQGSIKRKPQRTDGSQELFFTLLVVDRKMQVSLGPMCLACCKCFICCDRLLCLAPETMGQRDRVLNV